MSQLLAPSFIGTSRRPGADNSVRLSANERNVTDTSGVMPCGRETEPTVSCVIPCRNEAENLALLLPMLGDVLTETARSWEVILVDDGSTDDTPVLLQAWARIPGFRVLQLSRNFGKEAALTAGLEAAAGDVVIMMDADLQHSPALIPTFIRHWQQGADVAYAVRQDRSDEGRFKRVGTRWFYALVNAADRFEVPAGAGDFRLMDRSVVDALLSLPERNRFMKGLYAWVGFRTEVLPYTPLARHAGQSSFSLRRLASLAFTGITAFTNAPLRLWSAVGACIALAALGFGLWIVIEYFISGNDVPGWATLVTGLMFSAGIQLLSVGMLGEYVGRIFDEVKQRPVYIVGEEHGQGLTASREPAAVRQDPAS